MQLIIDYVIKILCVLKCTQVSSMPVFIIIPQSFHVMDVIYWLCLCYRFDYFENFITFLIFYLITCHQKSCTIIKTFISRHLKALLKTNWKSLAFISSNHYLFGKRCLACTEKWWTISNTIKYIILKSISRTQISKTNVINCRAL